MTGAGFSMQTCILSPHGTDILNEIFAHVTVADPGASRWPVAQENCTLLMGVLNVTPNSFSDGGQFAAREKAIIRALEIQRDGADILDIGGESTHPSAQPINAEEELARVIPVLSEIAQRLTIPVSIDTYKAKTAEAALLAGATIVNDIWGLQHDSAMAAVVAQHGAGLCIMHNRREVDTGIDIVADMLGFFEHSLNIAMKAGIRDCDIVLDPGIGFGKTFEQNLICLNRLSELRQFGRGILVGCSRKGFIGAYSGRSNPADRLHGTLGAHVAAVMNGARIIRAHDITPHKDALALADAILRPKAPPN